MCLGCHIQHIRSIQLFLGETCIFTITISIPWDAQLKGKKFFFFFALNWVFKPWQFCSNRGRFCNGVWVRAEERARIDTNGPILWRIVCRVCRWSFFWFLCTFMYFSLAHLIWTVVFGTSEKRCLKNTKLHILLISNTRWSGIQIQFKI